ncbi:MAG: glycosyltransferase family 2 protein [bacterium]|nr:glycosyltransferase family 2 protein [bacterium]
MTTRNAIPAIIPAYRNPDALARCLDHLSSQTWPVIPHVIDNSENNRLYTLAINEGLKQFLNHPCEHFLVLNQDMFLAADAVAEMVRLMELRRDTGIIMPLHLDPDDPRQVTCGGTEDAFPLGLHYLGPIDAFSEDRELPWANGAALLLRKEMVRDIGLLDASMRFFCSDVDYSFTARARGWKVWLSVKARGFHKPNASMKTEVSSLELVKCDDIIALADKWLTGDLYRRLASEGATLTPQFLADKMSELRRMREEIRQKLDRL